MYKDAVIYGKIFLIRRNDTYRANIYLVKEDRTINRLDRESNKFKLVNLKTSNVFNHMIDGDVMIIERNSKVYLKLHHLIPFKRHRYEVSFCSSFDEINYAKQYLPEESRSYYLNSPWYWEDLGKDVINSIVKILRVYWPNYDDTPWLLTKPAYAHSRNKLYIPDISHNNIYADVPLTIDPSKVIKDSDGEYQILEYQLSDYMTDDFFQGYTEEVDYD